MIIKPMQQKDALEIVKWHYEGIYAFYNQESDQEDLEEFIDPKKRGDSYFSVYDDDLIGFFSFTKLKNDEIYLGLGIRPNLTGKRLGLIFLKEGLNYINNHFSPHKISLAVATFNQRAIKVYQKAGFVIKEEFIQETNGGSYSFIKMELELK